MKTLIKISWRNIWRNPQRSLIMILAITVGLWGGLFAASIAMGLINQRISTSLEQEISHVQIHDPGFLRENSPRFKVQQWEAIRNELAKMEEVQGFSGRTRVSGMVSTASLTSGVEIIGVDPDSESSTTRLNHNLVEGDYFNGNVRNPVLMGKKLAQKMNARVGSRLVLTFQNIENELTAVSFRLAGIYQTTGTLIDEYNLYVLQSDLESYLESTPVINEVAILLSDAQLSDAVAKSLSKKFYPNTVRSWSEISPQLAYYYQVGTMMFMIILIIILLALAFGLLNTMLMSVFERVKELGVLMSIGMNKKRVFLMILLETTFLTLTGATTGIALGHYTVFWLGSKGLDLGAVGGESMQDFGFEAVVYPQLEPSLLVMLSLLVILTALLTSIYPALKALRLRPAEAVRKN